MTDNNIIVDVIGGYNTTHTPSIVYIVYKVYIVYIEVKGFQWPISLCCGKGVERNDGCFSLHPRSLQVTTNNYFEVV